MRLGHQNHKSRSSAVTVHTGTVSTGVGMSLGLKGQLRLSLGLKG